MSSTTRRFPQAPISVDRLQVFWKNLANTYFQGRLPPIRIEWSTRLTASTGMFMSQVGPRSQRLSLAERHGSARVIRLSVPLLHNQPESEIVRTLAHEMIHQWEYDVKKRHPKHGAEFLAVMDLMNRDGLGVTIRHSLDAQVEMLSKYAWQCLACGKSYRRQRRSISPRTHRCGSCHGDLRELSLNALEKIMDPERLTRSYQSPPFFPPLIHQVDECPRQLELDFG